MTGKASTVAAYLEGLPEERPLVLVGRAVARVAVADYVAVYEASRKAAKRARGN